MSGVVASALLIPPDITVRMFCVARPSGQRFPNLGKLGGAGFTVPTSASGPGSRLREIPGRYCGTRCNDLVPVSRRFLAEYVSVNPVPAVSVSILLRCYAR